MASHRTVTPFISWLRNALSGRKLNIHNRYAQNISPRTQPPPALPLGVSHKYSENYYHTRDGRRESQPPLVAFQNTPKAIESGEEGKIETKEKPKALKPGFSYNWQTGTMEH